MLVIGILLLIIAVIAIAFMVQAYLARRYMVGGGWGGYGNFLRNTLSGLDWSHFKYIMFKNHKRMEESLNDPKLTDHLDKMMQQLDEYIVVLKPFQYQALFQLKQLGYDTLTARRIICGFFLKQVETSGDFEELRRYTTEIDDNEPSVSIEDFSPDTYSREAEVFCKEYFQKAVVDNLEKFDSLVLSVSYTRFKYNAVFEKHIAK